MFLDYSYLISIGHFDNKWCNNIIQKSEKLKISEAKIQDGSGLNNTRSSKVSWLKDTKSEKDILDVISEHNGKAGWDFELTSIEPMQYTIYNENDHYSWHIDSHRKPYDDGNIRKLSFTICLNEDYEGGEVELATPNPNPEKHVFHRFDNKFITGTIITFPSFVWHKVNPVTFGTRKVLVGWVLGPKFK